MHPLSQEILGQVVRPEGPAAPTQRPSAPVSTFTLAEVLAPTGHPERRTSQVIVAGPADAAITPELPSPRPQP